MVHFGREYSQLKGNRKSDCYWQVAANTVIQWNLVMRTLGPWKLPCYIRVLLYPTSLKRGSTVIFSGEILSGRMRQVTAFDRWMLKTGLTVQVSQYHRHIIPYYYIKSFVLCHRISTVLATPTENNWKVCEGHWIFKWPGITIKLMRSNNSNVHRIMQQSDLLQKKKK